jgi:hypothetical protein
LLELVSLFLHVLLWSMVGRALLRDHKILLNLSCLIAVEIVVAQEVILILRVFLPNLID